MVVENDFHKFVYVTRVGGLPLVLSNGGVNYRRWPGFSMAKQPKQGKAVGVLAAIGLGWPTVDLGWCSWPLRLVA